MYSVYANVSRAVFSFIFHELQFFSGFTRAVLIYCLLVIVLLTLNELTNNDDNKKNMMMMVLMLMAAMTHILFFV